MTSMIPTLPPTTSAPNDSQEPSPGSPATPALPPKNWKQVEALKETKINELFTELREVDAEIAGLTATRERVRGLLAELVQPLGHGVIDFDLLATWVPEGKDGKKLDEKLLVQAGVTPDQLAAGYKKVEGKKAHLLVRAVEPADTTREGETGETTPAA